MANHLDVIQAQQRLKYPQQDFITRPMIVKLLDDLCRYYNFQLVSIQYIYIGKR